MLPAELLIILFVFSTFGIVAILGKTISACTSGNNLIYCFVVDFFLKLSQFFVSLFDFSFGYYEHSRIFLEFMFDQSQIFPKKRT